MTPGSKECFSKEVSDANNNMTGGFSMAVLPSNEEKENLALKI